MEMKCRAKVIEVKKKTKAEMFKNVQVGDVINFSVALASVGSRRGRKSSYAVNICCVNERTGERCFKTFNEVGRIIDLFSFEEIEGVRENNVIFTD